MSLRSNRKEEHLDLAQKFYQDEKPNSFDKMHLVRPALPETKVDLEAIKTTMFGKKIAAPFFINAMTGGSHRSYLINKELGRIANKTNIALALGSASILTKEPDLLDSFLIARQQDPDGALIANVNAKTSAEQAEKIVTELEADALQIHLNVVQEIAMPEGDRDFYWLDNLKKLRQKVTVPIIIKEVGFGLDRKTIRSNVSYLNKIGLPTVISSLIAAKEQVKFTVSGGVRNPLDVFKGLCLGGKFVGISNVFLQALLKHDADYLQNLIEEWQYELACLLAIYGQNDLSGLTKIDKYYDFSLKTIIDQLL